MNKKYSYFDGWRIEATLELGHYLIVNSSTKEQAIVSNDVAESIRQEQLALAYAMSGGII